MRETIKKEFIDVLEQSGSNLLIELTDDALLLNTALDSLGFAILVTQLESKLGYDPFSLMDNPFYPSRFGEYVEIYERFSHMTSLSK